MSAVYLIDTSAASKFLSGKDQGLRRFMHERATQLRLSAVAWYELRYGADKRPDLPRLEERLLEFRILIPRIEKFDEEAARRAAQVRAYLENLKPNAQTIGHYDLLLAGHALSLDAVFVTRNTSEFKRVPGLAVEDWL